MGARTTRAVAALAGLTAVLALASAPVATGSGETETVMVDAGVAAGAKTTRGLTAGVTYTVSASGTYSWGLAGGTADAECSSLTPDPTWQPNRFAALYSPDDNLDLYVNGAAVDWQPASGKAGDACDTATHTYRIAFTPKTTGPVTFAVVDKMNANKAGKLTVTVTAPETSPGAPAPTPPAPATRRPVVAARPSASPRVLSAAATSQPAAPRAAPVTPNNRGPFPNRPPQFDRRLNFQSIKAPTLPKRPFHLTTLGWLTLVLGIALTLAAATFVVATRSAAVDSSLRLAVASVVRLVVGHDNAAT